ncbi:hypothetical protein SAMN05444920_107270 [Nonomuraea solani]|uniref:WD40 repeat domain-containing protein n=1 Tax=Nonomuraea solani TaxID=1144553 RepID=A0A1H6E252_9ACTN|nr:hypothetical protein [Nonomuraea solani]SEG91461.1 hypothetical protein SAMN05444920_107270 [Nonomuraea solani]
MRILTTLALVAGLSWALTAPAAHAQPHEHDAIRYASIKGCAVKGGGTRPCGDWRLVMHSGEIATLPDGQGVALEANGSSSHNYTAAIAVSGNGRRVAYFTKKGRLAVRTVGGGAEVFAKDALPKVPQWEVTLRLSDDGERLAAVLAKETRIFDTATGALLGTVPAESAVLGFSGDGGELLTVLVNDETVTELIVYSDTGQELRRVAPPQVIASNSPQALAADGRTVASIVNGSKKELVTYDAEGDQLIGRKRIKLPAGEIHGVDWTGDTQVTVHLASRSSGPAKVAIAEIDTKTGAVGIRDRYTTLKDTFFFAACGG